MNELKLDSLALDAITLDRLADGELSPSEYRRVLQALDQQPAAWRKCAEAFLQAQAWQGDLGEVRASAQVKPEPKPAVEVTGRTSRAGDWLRMLLVAAASFLFAFLVAQAYWRGTEDNRVRDPMTPIASGPTAHESPQTTNVAGSQPLGKVQLAVNRNGNEEPTLVDVPVFDEAAASELLSNSRPALPDDLVEALEAEGHRVDRQRQLVPVRLDDGRQMMLPVEGYRIVPVSRPSY